jgi:hypothetical protein
MPAVELPYRSTTMWAGEANEDFDHKSLAELESPKPIEAEFKVESPCPRPTTRCARRTDENPETLKSFAEEDSLNQLTTRCVGMTDDNTESIEGSAEVESTCLTMMKGDEMIATAINRDDYSFANSDIYYTTEDRDELFKRDRVKADRLAAEVNIDH